MSAYLRSVLGVINLGIWATRLTGEDVRPLQNVKNYYNSRAHGQERLGPLTE
jgi:hypothetical protein